MSIKPRITLEELNAARKPGGAWNLAKKALQDGDTARAEAFVPFMVPSDQKLMRRRIEEAKRGGE